MKYLLLLAIVLAVVWLLRINRTPRGSTQAPPRQDPPAQPQDMVRCPVCALHLPRADALPGAGGRFYCCDEHRARAAAQD